MSSTHSNNRITQTSAVAIAKVFPSHEALRILKVSSTYYIHRVSFGKGSLMSWFPLCFQVGCNPIQPAGLAALLDGVKTCSPGTFECLDLSGITIPLDIEKAVGKLQESHPHISIPHGGVGGFKPPKPLLPPMTKLVKYCKEKKVELLDLFRLFDKEQRMILSNEEFRSALKVCEITQLGAYDVLCLYTSSISAHLCWNLREKNSSTNTRLIRRNLVVMIKPRWPHPHQQERRSRSLSTTCEKGVVC